VAGIETHQIEQVVDELEQAQAVLLEHGRHFVDRIHSGDFSRARFSAAR
jgi:hypothetical protein